MISTVSRLRNTLRKPSLTLATTLYSVSIGTAHLMDQYNSMTGEVLLLTFAGMITGNYHVMQATNETIRQVTSTPSLLESSVV